MLWFFGLWVVIVSLGLFVTALVTAGYLRRFSTGGSTTDARWRWRY